MVYERDQVMQVDLNCRNCGIFHPLINSFPANIFNRGLFAAQLRLSIPRSFPEIGRWEFLNENKSAEKKFGAFSFKVNGD